MVGNVFRDDCAGADEGVTADGVAADDGAVGAQSCASFDKGGANLIHFADFRAWVVDVGEDHGGAAKNTVFQCDTFIDADVILYFAFIADDGVGANDDVLADVAVFTDFGTGKNMRKMPNFRFFANFYTFVYDSRFVGEKTSSRFNVQCSMFNGRRTFYVQGSRFNGRRLFYVQSSMFNGRSVFYVQSSMFKVEGILFFLFYGLLAEF